MRAYKLGIFSVAFVGLFLSASTSSTFYTFKLLDTEGRRRSGEVATTEVSHIHFNAGGNDFGGLLVWRQAEGVRETIQICPNPDDTSCPAASVIDSIECTRQIRGLYYNSQRGERLRPLDDDTGRVLGFGSGNLTVHGGLFTSCGTGNLIGSETDPYGVFGHVRHVYKWNCGDDGDCAQEKMDLIAGLQYTGNKIQLGTKLFPTLQRFDNRFPLGVIYDDNGGLGFVGCRVVDGGNLEDFAHTFSTPPMGLSEYFGLTGTRPNEHPYLSGGTFGGDLDCSEIGMAIDTLFFLKIQGLIGLSSDVGRDALDILGNENDSKTQYFSSVNLNNATLINYAKRRAEEFCRERWTDNRGVASSADIVCWEGKGGTQDVYPNADAIKNKIVVVRNGSLSLLGTMGENDLPLNIFIDGGRLLVNMGYVTESHLLKFNDNAYVVAGGEVARGIFLKGNFIINGIIGGVTGSSELEPVDIGYRTFIHGKFTSLNTYSQSGAENRLPQVRDIVPSVTPEQINLRELFSWRCAFGEGTDGTDCPISSYQSSPLIIINQNYPSPLVE